MGNTPEGRSRELAEKLSVLDFLDSDINILNGRLRRLTHVVVYAVLAVLFGTTLELGGYSLWLTAGTIVWPGPMKRQSLWCKAVISPGLMWIKRAGDCAWNGYCDIYFFKFTVFFWFSLQFICSCIKLRFPLAMCKIQRYYRHRSQRKVINIERTVVTMAHIERIWGTRSGHAAEIVENVVQYLKEYPANYQGQVDTLLEMLYQAFTEYNSGRDTGIQETGGSSGWRPLRSLVETDEEADEYMNIVFGLCTTYERQGVYRRD